MKTLASFAFPLAMIGLTVAFAQTNQPVQPTGGSNYYGGGGGYPSYHSSTAAEGRMRGMGDLVRSQGEANLANSGAAINYSIARSNQIENRVAGTNAYFEMRQTNKAYRALERGPRATMEDLVRYAQDGKPKRLSPSELDTVTGTIQWPLLLQSDDFAEGRAELETAFGRRAASSVAGLADYRTIKKSADTMLASLKEQVRDVPPQEYTIAKKFLESLSFEARYPAG